MINKEINKKSKNIKKLKNKKEEIDIKTNHLNRKFAKNNLIKKLVNFKKIESFFSSGKLNFFNENTFVGILEGKIIFYDFNDHKIINKIEIENEEIIIFEINSSKQLIYIVTSNGTLREMELNTLTVLKSLKLYKFSCNYLIIDSSDKALILTDPKGDFKVIRIEDFKTFFDIKNHYGVLQVELNKINDKLYLIILTRDRRILFYDFYRMKIVNTIQTEDGLQFSNFKIFYDINKWYAAGFNNKIYVYSLKNFKLLKTFDGDVTINKLEILKLSEDKNYLLVLKESGSFDVYNIKKKGDLVFYNSYLNDNIHSLEDIISLNNKVYFVTEEREIFEYEIINNDFNLTNELISMNDEVLELKFINYDFLIIITNSSVFRIFNLKNNKTKLVRGHKELIICCETYKNRILTGSKDNVIILWNIQIENNEVSIEIKDTFKGHSKDIISLCFLHNNKDYFLSGSLDNSVKLWKIKEKTDGVENYCVQNVIAHNKDMNAVKISPNDKLFATCSHDRTVKLFNLKTFEIINEFKGHKRGVWDIEFNKVEKTLLSCSGDQTVRIWCLEKFDCLTVLEGHFSSLLKIKVLNFGLQLISAGNDGSIKLWNLKKGIIMDSYENNEGKIWAIDTIEDNSNILNNQIDDIPEFRLTTGDNSGNIIIWHNHTEEQKLSDLEFTQNNVVKILEVENLLKNKNYELAAIKSFDNNMKKKFINSILSLDKVLSNDSAFLYNISLDQSTTKDFSLKYEILNRIIKHCISSNFNQLIIILRDFNTSNKYAGVIQLIMRFLFKNMKINEMVDNSNKLMIENLGKSIEFNSYLNVIKNYSEKHLDRFESLYKDIISFDKIIEKYGIIN